MATRDRRYTEFVAIKMPVEMVRRVRERARDDDRPVSVFLRRLIAESLGMDASSTEARSDAAHTTDIK
jgi:hypothetical protein